VSKFGEAWAGVKLKNDGWCGKKKGGRYIPFGKAPKDGGGDPSKKSFDTMSIVKIRGGWG